MPYAGIDGGREMFLVVRRFVETAADGGTEGRVEHRRFGPGSLPPTKVHARVRKIGRPILLV
jgi:hypothetical protein